MFLAGAALARLLWDHISLPFSNPHEVVGLLAISGYNPDNNVVRFACFVIVPILILVLAYALTAKRMSFLWSSQGIDPESAPKKTGRRIWRVAGVAGIFAFVILGRLNLPTDLACWPLDTFHEGEVLGPAMSWLDGQTPYGDFAVLHGVFQDPLRAVIAFRLFGRSIGAVRTLQSILKLVALRPWRRSGLSCSGATCCLPWPRFWSCLGFIHYVIHDRAQAPHRVQLCQGQVSVPAEHR